MVLKDINNVKQTLVELSDDCGNTLGLYLVPEGITIEAFERHYKKIGDQNTFDESNSLGVQRIYAYESIISF